MTSLRILMTALGFSILAACSDKVAEKTEPAHVATQADGHDEGGDAHSKVSEKRTHFTERTELFIEFPRLVVGEKTTFAAHLTHLSDFRAVTAAKVGVRLSGAGQPDEVFAVEAPSQPGIFRPDAIPKHAGERKLAVEVRTSIFTVVHELGPVTVYANHNIADAAPMAEENHAAEGISFTKEQQWKVDFATTAAVTRSIRTAVAAPGILRARPDGEAIVAAPVPGQIQPTAGFPRLGQTVQKGQLLAYLLPRLGSESDLATLRAEARQAEVTESLARQELARLEGLFRDEAVPERRVHAARAEAATARARLDAANQRLSQHGGEAGTGGIPLRAPVSGTLVDVHVSPGAPVQDGTPLFHIADRSRLWLELRVPESAAGRFAQPGGAAFQVTNDDTRIEIVPGKNGRLVAVGGVVDAVTRTLPVVFEFDTKGLNLPIGMAVAAQVFVGAPRQAVAIPASSVLDEGGLAVVFVQVHGELFERRTLRLGAREGDWVEVLDGISPSQRVVSKGAYLVKLASTGTARIGHGHAH